MVDSSVTRPRVLFVARTIPYVPSFGGLTRTFHFVHALAGIADVALVGAPENPLDPRTDMARELCAELYVLGSPPGEPPRLLNEAVFRARDFVSRHPAARPIERALDLLSAIKVRYRLFQGSDSSGLQAEVEDLLGRESFDAVVVEHTYIAALLAETMRRWNGPSIADLHNVMHAMETRARSVHRGPRADARTVTDLEAAERLILESYTRTAVVSETEAVDLCRLSSSGAIEVIPNGVDTGYFGAIERRRDLAPDGGERVKTLLFTGLLYHEPNVDALGFFVRDVLPHIRRRLSVRLWIVGAGPVPPAVRRLANEPGIETFVSVPDVRPYFAASDVVVVPIRWGGGTRLKILEALAARSPVVSTTFGAEGLDLQPERDLMTADSPTAFAAAVVELLLHPDRAHELARQGTATVERLYAWDRIEERVRQVLREVLARPIPRAPGNEPG